MGPGGYLEPRGGRSHAPGRGGGERRAPVWARGAAAAAAAAPLSVVASQLTRCFKALEPALRAR